MRAAESRPNITFWDERDRTFLSIAARVTNTELIVLGRQGYTVEIPYTTGNRQVVVGPGDLAISLSHPEGRIGLLRFWDEVNFYRNTAERFERSTVRF